MAHDIPPIEYNPWHGLWNPNYIPISRDEAEALLRAELTRGPIKWETVGRIGPRTGPTESASS